METLWILCLAFGLAGAEAPASPEEPPRWFILPGPPEKEAEALKAGLARMRDSLRLTEGTVAASRRSVVADPSVKRLVDGAILTGRALGKVGTDLLGAIRRARRLEYLLVRGEVQLRGLLVLMERDPPRDAHKEAVEVLARARSDREAVEALARGERKPEDVAIHHPLIARHVEAGDLDAAVDLARRLEAGRAWFARFSERGISVRSGLVDRLKAAMETLKGRRARLGNLAAVLDARRQELGLAVSAFRRDVAFIGRLIEMGEVVQGQARAFVEMEGFLREFDGQVDSLLEQMESTFKDLGEVGATLFSIRAEDPLPSEAWDALIPDGGGLGGASNREARPEEGGTR